MADSHTNTLMLETTGISNAEPRNTDVQEDRVRETCYQPLKDLVYENYTLMAPDGRILCRCGRKKVDWYLSRGLAMVQKDDPTSILLNFVPGGHGEDGDAYQLAEKHNHCVVCGRDDHNTKHHIVEYEYRQHMPVSYKSHNSYDLMILCGPCHTRYEVHAMQLKNSLAKKYDAPVNGKGWSFDSDLGKLKKAANALLSPSLDSIPLPRVSELRQLIRNHLGLPPTHSLTVEELQEVQSLDPIIRSPDFMSHGAAVVSCLNSPEALTDFIQMWRRHFVDTMQPKFIHPAWSIDRGKSELREPKESNPTPVPSDTVTSSPLSGT